MQTRDASLLLRLSLYASSQPGDRAKPSVPGRKKLIVRVVVSETCSDTRVEHHSDKLDSTRSTCVDTLVIGILPLETRTHSIFSGRVEKGDSRVPT